MARVVLMVLMVLSPEGHGNILEVVPVTTKTSLVVPSSEGRGKLGSSSKIGLSRLIIGIIGTTIWFTVEYCHTMPPAQTPHGNELCRKGNRAASDNNYGCRPHKCIDIPANGEDTSMDETAPTATASMPMDTATPNTDQAKATRDQGQPTMTSTSAQNTSCDLLDILFHIW